jgi:hypothetical protein
MLIYLSLLAAQAFHPGLFPLGSQPGQGSRLLLKFKKNFKKIVKESIND